MTGPTPPRGPAAHLLAAAALLATLVAACGEPASESRPAAGGSAPSAERAAPPAPAPSEGEAAPDRSRRSRGHGADADRVAVRALDDPAAAGTIRGTVRFEGTPPERFPLSGVAKTAGCLHDDLQVPLSESVIVTDGKLANVFVWVRRGLPRDWTPPPPPTAPVHLDQLGCTYRPHVLGMRVGQTLEVRNDDPVTHNVNCQSQKNDRFNRTQAPRGRAETWTPEKAEVMTAFGCNIHPWMSAWVGVVDHPFFAVTGTDGAFALEGLPPAEVELEAWHERYGRLRADVTVSERGGAEVTFAFRPE